MNKEIQEFQESFFFGLSMRQCFFSVLAIAAAVGVYLGTKDTCGTEIAGWLSVFAAAPFAGCGFFRYHQMTLEKFVWVWLKSEILCPKKLVFQSENLYLKCLEEKKQKQEEPDRLRVLPVEIRGYLFGRITSKEIHGQF